MKNTKTREIVIEIERVRPGRERPIIKKPGKPPEKQKAQFETFGCANAFAKNGNRLEHLFNKLF